MPSGASNSFVRLRTFCRSFPDQPLQQHRVLIARLSPRGYPNRGFQLFVHLRELLFNFAVYMLLIACVCLFVCVVCVLVLCLCIIDVCVHLRNFGRVRSKREGNGMGNFANQDFDICLTLGWHYLSNATCRMRSRSFYTRFVLSRIIISCYIIRHL